MKPTTLLLVLSLLFTQPLQAQEEPLPALIIGGILVLVIGGVVMVRAVKRCQRIAKQREREQEEERRFIPAGFSYGAYFSHPTEGACYVERLMGKPITFCMTISVASDGTASMTLNALEGWQYSQAFEECTIEATGHGLTIPDSLQQSASYSMNGQPCSREECPIRFNHETATTTVGSGGVLVTVEHSDDLVLWSPLMKLNVARGSVIQADDASMGGSGFYRIQTSKP